ncbi:hypothetical protein WJU23_05285 [Prosthecobacter sp. SYSU 5D2]|uniref:hypothetical protein n=1 Tax=Prosthecobacter sp. SYSU 5D2 TaxID=3134134 RepID=UPI0031FE877B
MTDFAPQSPATFGDVYNRKPPLNFGGGGGDAAAAEAKKARLASIQAHRENMTLAREQMRQAANIKSADYTPASAPQSTNIDTVEAGRDQRKRQKMRFGTAATQIAQSQAVRPALGGIATLG